MKKLSILLIIGLALFNFNLVYADDPCQDLSPEVRSQSSLCSNYRDDQNQEEIQEYLKNIIFKIIPWIAGIAILMIIYAGFVYTTSAGEANKVKLARDIIKFTVIGIIVIMLAGTIVGFVLDQVTKMK